VDPNETCDGDCPTRCEETGEACTSARLIGDPRTCSSECVTEVIFECAAGDGCCPAGCSNDTDADCPDTDLCGNGVLDEGETCDGDCPTRCPDDACTVGQLTGSPAACTARCTYSEETRCLDGDGCCPDGCSAGSDSDCGGTPPDEIGTPCETAADCEGGVCLSAIQGYCSRECDAVTPCPDGSHCSADGLCVVSCSTDAQCARSGYECYDRDGDAITECFAVGDGTGQVGDPCDDISECTGGERAACFVEAGGFRNGYCSLRCERAGETCPNGTHCENGVCLRSCERSEQCRTDGYLCYNRSSSGSSTECFPAGTGDTPVGGACEGVWDCAGGSAAVCQQDGFPGGHCTRTCLPFFGGDCPMGSHCTTTTGSCVDSCQTSADCRDGYLCDPDLTNPFDDTGLGGCAPAMSEG
jgi:hypothetical protein